MTTQHTTTGAENTTAARYTPGPWEIDGNEIFANGDYFVARVTENQYTPHTDKRKAVTRQNWSLAEEDKANARLITAAPELFDIVSALVSHAESIAETYGDDAPLTGGIVELALRARAVVNEVNQPA
jgi:hypothetical protein